MQKTNDYVRNFVTIFFIQKTIIFTVTLVIIIGAFLFALLYPPIYAATCSVILKGSISLKNPESIEKIPSDISKMRETDIYSEIEIIKANVVAEKTVEELVQKGLVFDVMDSEESRRAAVSKVMGSLEPTINPRTDTINIQTTWNDPEEARLVLETLVRKYFDYRSEIFKPKEAEAFFAEQLKNFSDELERKENELMVLTKISKTPDSAMKIKNNMMNADDMEKQLLNLKQQYFDQKYKVALMEKDIRSNEGSYFSYIGDPKINDMSGMVMEIIKQRNIAARTFHPQSQKIQNYNKQIADAIGSFKSEMRNYIESQKAELNNIEYKMDYLENRIKQIREESMTLYEASTQGKMLTRQIAVLEDSYTTFTKRLEEAKISNNYKTNNLFTVSLLTKPEAKNSPIFPNKQKVIFLGIIGGIICGVAAGFTMEFFNHTFKTPEDVENNTDMVYIFSIPE
ncbi:MAG: hypothetical protein KKF12_00070 [Proteobacteria bacterium]|nr:hypothetical protein [Desulfobacula sp.]MBU3950555.1 hypothetical protein [Pseudomonadota bacterium]MBU4129192.1 hypothetical protein [Pseudomonadota bacterium]